MRTWRPGRGGASLGSIGMPIEVTLHNADKHIWRYLRACPSLGELGAAKDAIDVTALALIEDIYGRSYSISAADEAFLAREAGGSVLLPGDVHDETGQPLTSFAGTVRASFLGWVASVARRNHSTITISYLHERGDFPYELARWRFGPREELLLVSFDGSNEPRWERFIERSNEQAPEPRDQRFYPFAELLRDVKPR